MFKTASSESEIMQAMSKGLSATHVEQVHGFDKLAKAADYLSAAAEIFDDAGFPTVADDITAVLQGLVKQLNPSE